MSSADLWPQEVRSSTLRSYSCVYSLNMGPEEPWIHIAHTQTTNQFSPIPSPHLTLIHHQPQPLTPTPERWIQTRILPCSTASLGKCISVTELQDGSGPGWVAHGCVSWEREAGYNLLFPFHTQNQSPLTMIMTVIIIIAGISGLHDGLQ